MQQFAWKHRLTMGLGIGIASIALIAGCSDEEDSADDLDVDTETTVTETTTTTTEPTETTESTGTATGTTEATGTATATGDTGTAEDVALSITADGVMLDGTMSEEVTLTAGSTVTFTNDGDAAVNVTTDDGAIDEEVEPGDSFEYTFEEAGTWMLSVDGTEVATITVE